MWPCVGERQTGENMRNHSRLSCLAESPGTINPGEAVPGSLRASLSPGSWGQQFTLHPYSMSCRIHLSLLSTTFWGISKETVAAFFFFLFAEGWDSWVWGQTEGRQGLWGERWEALRYSSCSSPRSSSLYLCHSFLLPIFPPFFHQHPGVLIKEKIFLMPPSSSSAQSISVCPLPHFSFLPLSRVKEPGSLPSACLWNLWAEPRYALSMLKPNALPLPLLSLYPLLDLGMLVLNIVFLQNQWCSYGLKPGGTAKQERK